LKGGINRERDKEGWIIWGEYNTVEGEILE
jgi:hypothetical protein